MIQGAAGPRGPSAGSDDLLVFRIFGVPQGSILRPSTEFGVFVDQKVLLMVLLNFQNQLRTELFLLVCEIFQVCLTYQPLEVKVDGGVSRLEDGPKPPEEV